MKNEGIGFYRGYDIYMGFTKWLIAKKTVQLPMRFNSYKDATDYIDKNLAGKTMDIHKWLSHADTIKTMGMKKIFLTQVGFKQIEKGAILSTTYYVSYDNYILLVPFCFLKHGKVIKKGVNLYTFLQENKLVEIKEIFKQDIAIVNGKITKNKVTVFDCSKIDWKTLLNAARGTFEINSDNPINVTPLDN